MEPGQNYRGAGGNLRPFILKGGVLGMVELTEVTMDMGIYGALAGAVLSALALVWGLRKMIRLINRS